MVKVQDELYAMLGIPLESGSLIRRPRSMSGAGEPEPSPVTSQIPLPRSTPPSKSNRPLSFPGTIGAGSMLADDVSIRFRLHPNKKPDAGSTQRQAILATLGLMSG
jgi:hypothetical protein